MAQQLSDAQLKATFTSFDPGVYGGWLDRYLARVAHYQGLDASAFASPDVQRTLWSETAVSSLGAGEYVRVGDVAADARVVEALQTLRTTQWPLDAVQRGQRIQAAFDQLLEDVKTRHGKRYARARLHRAFAVLLPEHVHIGLSTASHRDITDLLVGKRRGAELLTCATLARARLREVLGPEPDLGAHVHRSIFCWWLHEQQQHAPAQAPVQDDPARPPTPPEPPLELLPYHKLKLGLANLRDFLLAQEHIVRSCWEPVDLHELVEVLQVDFGYTQAGGTLRAVIRQAAFLGVLERTPAGLYQATDAGEDFLLQDPPHDFIEALLTRVYGPAQVLRLASAGPLRPQSVIAHLDALGWATPPRIYSVMSRLAELGLLDAQAGTYTLTDEGQRWHGRLPKDLPKPPHPRSNDPAGGGSTTVSGEPAFATLVQHFASDDDLKQLVFTRDQLRALHAAWTFHPRKRFCILSGLSGTGKTRLLTAYAELTCRLMDLDPTHHLAVVAVSPDWQDPSGLLGYLNALHAEPTYQLEPALRVILDAAANPHSPYFLVLDEMNLARVERYMAPLLSAMESGQPIELHSHDQDVNDVPGTVRWPSNLRIGGTVNMDESTHAFSDKVLDRAFTLEFWHVDLAALFARRSERDRPLEALLLALYAALQPVRRHFGYRTAEEVLDWVATARSFDTTVPVASAWDQAVFSKVLPRLRGPETPALVAALEALHALFIERDMPQCRDKVHAMRARLTATGVTGFWS